MTTEPANGNGKRARRTPEQREAALKAELESLASMRRQVLARTMAAAATQLEVIAETSLDIGPLRDECRGLAVRLRGWA